MEMSEEVELSCALLLGDTAELDFLVAQLSEDKLVTIRTWPIWSLRSGEPLLGEPCEGALSGEAASLPMTSKP